MTALGPRPPRPFTEEELATVRAKWLATMVDFPPASESAYIELIAEAHGAIRGLLGSYDQARDLNAWVQWHDEERERAEGYLAELRELFALAQDYENRTGYGSPPDVLIRVGALLDAIEAEAETESHLVSDEESAGRSSTPTPASTGGDGGAAADSRDVADEMMVPHRPTFSAGVIEGEVAASREAAGARGSMSASTTSPSPTDSPAVWAQWHLDRLRHLGVNVRVARCETCKDTGRITLDQPEGIAGTVHSVRCPNSAKGQRP